MAITFNPNIQYYACSSMFGTGAYFNSTQTGISIHSGTRPTAADVSANWSLYKYSNSSFLAAYTGGWGNIWSYNSTTNAWTVNTTVITTQSATNTGTGTWAIIWSSVSQNNPSFYYNQSTVPNAQFIVVDVSDISGSGVLRLNTTSFTAGVNNPIADITVKMTSP